MSSRLNNREDQPIVLPFGPQTRPSVSKIIKKMSPLRIVPSSPLHSIRGFTMIELLSVVAIVAILASLIIPAVSGAKEKALASKCLSNLRQIGAGLTLYAAENNGYLPPSSDENGKNWDQGAIYPYLPARTNQNGSERQGMVFVCPSAKYAGFPNVDLSRTYSSTDAIVGPDNDYRAPRHTATLPRLSGTLLLFDAKQNASNRYCQLVTSWNQISGSGDLASGQGQTTYIDYRHNKNFHGLFADGHTEVIPRKNAQSLLTVQAWSGK